jgi:hypothetical protein
MATKRQGLMLSWLIAILSVPIELLLAIPTRQYLYDIGLFEYSGRDLFGFGTAGIAFGLFGLFGLAILLAGVWQARRMGVVPRHKVLTAVYGLGIVITSLQVVLLVLALLNR